MPYMKTVASVSLAALLILGLALPACADDLAKDEQTLTKAAAVLQSMVSDKAIPADVLSKVDCIIILPGVKKLAVGVGGSSGRGPMSCRAGKDFNGEWSAPAMYTIGGLSGGLQLGGSSSDFVLLLMTPVAVEKVLAGKSKMGTDMTVAAGPGATSPGQMSGTDVLTYARAKGAFAGISLSGATLDPDNGANSQLYKGKYNSTRDIVIGNTVTPTTGGQALIAELDKLAKPSK